ncbi:SET-binding protein-like [Megalops cyprinoides]|uniref:SET-binding protein-like n=1 Tax=Megalops cyprinoides TaxID=118141 RepID=UPI0018649C85|nr:SET-binding protein-like [Megalops cyprinoides]
MEQRELGAGFGVSDSMSDHCTLPERVRGLLPVPEEGLPELGGRVEPEQEDDLTMGEDEYSISNLDSEKWAQGDGLEEQEFSIKEASFAQGSLKLKIQTTKRTKKPPKILENYICPPEIRITIKQPGEQKPTKLVRCSLGDQEEESVIPRKKICDTPCTPTEQNPSDSVEELLGESLKPKQQPRSHLQHQIEWTQPPAGGGSPEGNDVIDCKSKSEPTVFNENSFPDLSNTITKSLQRKATGNLSSGLFSSGMASQIPGSQMKPPSAANMPPATQTNSNQMMLTTSNKDKGLQEVTELVFGNIKRKYGRKDSIRNMVAYSLEFQQGKKAEKNLDTDAQDKTKERHISLLEKTAELTSGETESTRQKAEKESELLTVTVPQRSSESIVHSWRKRRYGESLKHAATLEDLTEETSELNRKTGRGLSEPKPPNKIEPKTAKQVEDGQPEAVTAVAVTEMIDIFKNRLRKNPARKLDKLTDSSDQTDTKLINPKGKESWSYLKSKNSTHQENSNGLTANVSEPPSAYPITPSSPLYTNTDSLTVITPLKKKRGRPKKQPLLTVETIHEGTSNGPLSPIAEESHGTLKKRKNKHNCPKLFEVKAPPGNQVKHNRNTGQVGVRDKNNKKIKMMKMKHILNEILSCSANSNLVLKSKTPVSNTVSTVASKIEARLGKQINISKRGTIYIGKKRGRKPKAEVQVQVRQDQYKVSDKCSASSQFENPAVPFNPQSTAGIASPRTVHSISAQATGAGGILCPVNTEISLQESKTMPHLQPVSALPTRAPRGYHSGNWKLSPPQLMTNSPSHLSEVASLKEVTLSPVSESHSEETIPSDSGIGTDNNSTSDQAEKGPTSRRRYSFDFCSLEPSEAAALDATSRAKRGHCSKHVTAATVGTFLSQESLKKQKHRRKRKGLQRRDDLQFLADLDELIGKFQVFRISHHSYRIYHENSYPSIFRMNFDHYYPVPYIPFDPLYYFRRNSEMKSKKRRGRPAKDNAPMSKMPFIPGFGYPFPSGNYYAPYAMPYTPMPVATSMNLGYYGQYPAPLFLSHTLGAATSSFLRPATTPSKFPSSAHVKLTAAAKHKIKLSSQPKPPAGMDNNHPLLEAPKGGSSNLSSVWLHKRKHKHKHKHSEDQSRSKREDLGGLFSGTKNPCVLTVLSEELGISDKGPTLPKRKDKQRNQQNTDTLLRSSRNIFEMDSRTTLSLSDSQQWKCARERGEAVHDLHSACSSLCTEGIRNAKDVPSDLLRRVQSSQELQSGIRNVRQSLETFGVFREQNMVPFRNSRGEKVQSTFQCLSPSLEEHSRSLKKRFKRAEIEEIQCEVRKMCAFSKILSTKKNLGHVNKILKAKRLQRQAKTGNNIVKKRRGRPRKQPLSPEDEGVGQMPVLERCVDLPGRKSSYPTLAPELLEFSNQDSIMDAIESVVLMARAQPKSQPVRGGKRWHKTSEDTRPKRPRRCRGDMQEEVAMAERKQSSSGLLAARYSSVHSAL